MSNTRLKIAVPKGRIMEEAIEMWRKAGLSVPVDIEDTRKLILTTEDGEVEWILSKPMDVPTYVEYGVADIGIAGKDVLMETGREVYELLDLKISQCRLSVAGLPDVQMKGIMPRIASKYPRSAEKFFREQGKQVEVIELHGSVELGPIVGLADRIVDIVSTGRTLQENGLVEYETIAEISTRLIANQVSYRMKQGQIKEIIERLHQVI